MANRIDDLSRHLRANATSAKMEPGEALRALRMEPEKIREVLAVEPDFDVNEMKKWLDHDNLEMRDELREFLKHPLFRPDYDMLLKDERKLALDQLRKLSENPGRFYSVLDFRKNPTRIFAAHEICCLVSGSFATKLTVQANLFGGTVLKLGTEKHYGPLVEKIDAAKEIGCFCLTELGFGNNAIELETTADFDESSSQFVINSPTPLSQKYWITNGANDSTWACVFAQTTIRGKAEGVQCFLVKIRDENLNPMPGVTIRDMGRKFGQNGVDNAIIAFDHVRVPFHSLLDAKCSIDANGNFHTDIKSRRGRFLVSLNQLYSGRLCLASKAVGRTKQALTIAVRYATTRLAVGQSGKSDTPIMQYQLQQRALIPLIARCYILSGLGMNYVKSRYQEESCANGLGTSELSPELQWLCSGIKALVTWNAKRTGETCRERCGGAGYLGANMFYEIIADAHAISTAEGDNSVLMQKVAKEVLSAYKTGTLSLPVLGEKFNGFEDFRNLQYLSHIMSQREAAYAVQLQGRMDRDMNAGAPLFEVWMKRSSDEVQGLAKAFVERRVFEECLKSIEKSSVKIRHSLEKLACLFAMDSFDSDIGFLLINKIIPSEKGQEMLNVARELCSAGPLGLADQAMNLCKAFAIPDHLLPPAARDWIKYNTVDNKGQVRGIEF